MLLYYVMYNLVNKPLKIAVHGMDIERRVTREMDTLEVVWFLCKESSHRKINDK